MSKKIIDALKQKQELKISKNDLILFDSLRKNFSKNELNSLLDSAKFKPSQSKKINFNGKHFKIGVLSDSHIGSVYFNENWFKFAINKFIQEKCKFIVHCGDITEGLSHRPGHYYELTHIGFDQQKKYAIDLFAKVDLKMYMIDGNHDRWYLKSNGGLIVKDICQSVKNCYFLGHDEGIINLNGIKIMLWHGEDSSSYATSYRIQKLIESFTGGEKPNLLITGHVHKQGYFFERNIHVISAGAISQQSKWMRSKRLANHSGFHIIELTINQQEIKSCKVEWFPFYETNCITH